MEYQLQELNLSKELTEDVDEIIQQIKATPKKDLVSIINRFEISERIIRTENLVFHNNSELVFTNYDLPYVVIAAKNLKFNAPLIKSTVKMGEYNLAVLKGEKGATGADGGESQAGLDGGTGTKGNRKDIPDIYLFVENIATDHGELSTFDWQIQFNGLKGGQGGDGGNGGNGGAGRKGRNSSSGPGFCNSGAGGGGNGGNSGRGGQGGEGGDGSEGAIVYLVGTKTTTDRLTYAKFFLEGGAGGEGGTPGLSGQAGSGGAGGNGSRHCSGGSSGSNGQVLGNLGQGTKGKAGERGEIKIITRSISDIF
jgi:hypothetical protein